MKYIKEALVGLGIFSWGILWLCVLLMLVRHTDWPGLLMGFALFVINGIMLMKGGR